MNVDQKTAFDTIDVSISNHEPKLFFLDAPGGTGKTFVFNTLLSKYRSQKKIILATASSGIAALLLAGAKTSHAMYGIPLICHEESSSSIRKRSDAAEMLKQADALFWDEAPMSSKNVVKVVDKLFRELTGNMDAPFGGKCVVFSGDFRQTLAVLKRGNRSAVIGNLLTKLEW